MSEAASEISKSIYEQERTTQEISRNMQEAASGNRHIEDDLSTVTKVAEKTSQAASQTGAASSDVAHCAAALKAAIDQFLKGVAAA